MKILMKLLTVFVAFTLALGGSALAFSDTEGTAYRDEAALLSTFGILNGYSSDEFGGDKLLTRAELATSLTRMLGYSDDSLSAPDERVYVDVAPEHWAYAYVYKAYELGIMTGSGDGYFKPDENVSYNEAVKVMTAALGFSQIAEAKGGYPSGYKTVATSEGLLSGVSQESDGKITRGNLARLIYNTLHAKCLETVGLKNGDALNEKSRTFMEAYLDIKLEKDVVRACEDISLDSSSGIVPEGRFILGDEVYFIGETSPMDCIGKKVSVYYKEENDIKTAVYILNSDKLSTEKVIPAELITKDSTLTKLVYKKDENSSQKLSLNISDDAEILYNNRLLSVKKAEDLYIKDGQIRLIDNNRDNKYDVVFIEEYETYVVASVASTINSINLKFGEGTLDLDPDKNDISVKYYLDGEENELTSITANSVLSVMKSKNIDGMVLISVYCSQTTEDIEVAKIKNQNGKTILVSSDGAEFKLNASYEKRIAENNSKSVIPEAGKAYTAYFDINGRVVHLEDKETTLNYGYLIYAKVFDEGMDKTAKFRIFTQNAEFVDFEAKENILFNGVTAPSVDVVASFLDSYGDTESRLVAYKADSQNRITELTDATDKTSDPLYFASEGEFVLNYSSDSGLRFYKNMAEYKPYIFKNSQTVHFLIPADKTRTKDYKVASKLSSTDVSLKGPMKIYNVSDGGKIGAVVSSASGATSKLSNPAIVESIGIAVDDNGDPCKMLYFFGGASVKFTEDEVTYNFPTSLSNGEVIHWSDRVDYSNVKIGDLKKGDVVEYSLTTDNQIDELRVVLRVSDVGLSRMDDAHIAENGNIIAEVASVSEDGSSVVLNACNYTGVSITQAMSTGGTVYRYSSADDEIYYSSKAEIRAGDTVLINSFWWSAKLIYIIR